MADEVDQVRALGSLRAAGGGSSGLRGWAGRARAPREAQPSERFRCEGKSPPGLGVCAAGGARAGLAAGPLSPGAAGGAKGGKAAEGNALGSEGRG